MTEMKTLLVLACATLGGWAMHLLGVPLAWLIGALIVSSGFALAGVQTPITRIRAFGLIGLGLSLGQGFTPEIVQQVWAFLPIILVCSMITLGLGLPMMSLFIRHAGLSPSTAFFSATPGGVVLMAVQAGRMGASERHVVLAQSIRLMVVVLLYPAFITLLLPDHRDVTASLSAAVAPLALADLPVLAAFIAGGVAIAFAAQKTFLPNPWMIAPCLLSIALTASGAELPELPHGLTTVCQVILGTSLGARMSRNFLLTSGRLAIVSAAASVILTIVLVIIALLVSRLTGLDTGAVLFGMSPGGMPEMTVAARATGVAVPLVLSFHLTRILLGNLVLEPLWKWLSRRPPFGTLAPATSENPTDGRSKKD